MVTKRKWATGPKPTHYHGPGANGAIDKIHKVHIFQNLAFVQKRPLKMALTM